MFVVIPCKQENSEVVDVDIVYFVSQCFVQNFTPVTRECEQEPGVLRVGACGKSQKLGVLKPHSLGIQIVAVPVETHMVGLGQVVWP